MNVSVFCLAKFHAFYLAEQLHKHQALDHLYTSFYGKIASKQNNENIDLPYAKVRTHLLLAFMAYTRNPFSELRLWQLFGEWAARYIENEDIVVSWGLAALPIIEQAKQRNIISIVERGSAHVRVQRDILLEEYEAYGQPTDALMRSFSPQRMERELLEYEMVDYISVPSQFAKRSFVEQGVPEAKIIKINYGVNLSRFHQIPKQDNVFRVIYAGAMTLRKGIQYLLKAFADLNLPNAELWLIGNISSETETFFKRYEGSFRHFGAMPMHELHKYYAQGSVFGICSLEEGMAMVQPQAMSCGLPLICTTNTGGDDMITDGVEGFVVPIRNVEAIKEKLLYLYENHEICVAMGQAAKRKVQQGLSWDDYGRSVMEAYEGLLKNP